MYPTGQDVLAYIQDLYDTLRYKTVSDEAHITRLKKYLNFIGLGIDPQGHFPACHTSITLGTTFL